MKPYTIIILFFTLFFLFPQQGIAQRGSIKRLAAADQAFTNYQYNNALSRYKKAYSRTRNKVEKDRILFQMATCYRFTNDIRRAEVSYRRLLRTNYERREPLVLLYYGDMLRASQKYNEAEESYLQYIELVPEDPRGETGLQSARLARDWVQNPTKYEINSERKLNTREDDFAPVYADRNFSSLLFTSNRDGVAGKGVDDWTGLNYTDFFYARRDPKGDWSTPVLADSQEQLNTGSHEGVGALTQRFSLLYFTRCYSQRKENEYGQGCQIYTSRRESNSWGEPQKLDLGGDSTNIVGHPTLSSDERTIIFVADFADGHGGKDLYKATRKSTTDNFGRPVNLGPNINTSSDEMFPFLRNDTILYFSSNGHPGMGGLDIFKSSLVDDEWQKPVNMQYPLNSATDDFAIAFHPEDEQGYFSSNRRGGRGGDDIYSFTKPPLVFTLQGTVKDIATLQFIPAVSVRLIGSDGSNVEAKTDPKGFYSFARSQIKPNTTYDLTVNKENYFIGIGRITTVDVFSNRDFVLDVNLEPIPKKPIPLPEIRYELAKWDLLPQYQDSLQGLIRVLDQNETIVIELAAHTDSRNTFEYNDILSQKRAESVVNYLIMRGITPDRLKAKGYGERVPRTLEKDITIDGFTFKAGTALDELFIELLPTVAHREAAHQLNRRTEFSVLSKDYVPKTKSQVTTSPIEIVLNPDENVVSYRSGETGEVYVPCILNGYNLIFTLNTNDKNAVTVSLDQAMKLLLDGAINRNDFEGDAEKVLGAGSIANNAIFSIREIRVGKKTTINLKATVVHKQADPLMLGENILKQFGEYSIDRNKKQIIFK
ncbi:MAG: OmpA family protein [Bacteroidales bacterium]|nr:OmpA family protein [Bacteroidales bacterium]